MLNIPNYLPNLLYSFFVAFVLNSVYSIPTLLYQFFTIFQLMDWHATVATPETALAVHGALLLSLTILKHVPVPVSLTASSAWNATKLQLKVSSQYHFWAAIGKYFSLTFWRHEWTAYKSQQTSSEDAVQGKYFSTTA